MKEMVGGCCVCSDERGWPDNPLVYCDGNGCTVAVHQACYGIVTVPTGPWFCRKCESPDTKGKVRCELCPSRSGALKRTDTGGWAHVVCALYIPEVRFGNVTSMEPIVLRLIPPERYNKTCYICHDVGKPHRASAGACMQCNKSGCKQQFHVTCAQSLGLLCEEAGNYLDNVKYCGYCQHHYSKLKKGGNVKTIPPYKPVSHDSHSSDSSCDKDGAGSPQAAGSGTPTHANKSKGPGRKSSHSGSGKNTPSSSKQSSSTPQPPMEKKKSPSRRGSSTGEGGSKTSTPAPSPQHSSEPPTPAKVPSSQSQTPKAPSSPTNKPAEAVGVISSVASAVAAAPVVVPSSCAVVTTSVVQQKPSFQESVITNTDAMDTKHTKKRKAAAAAAAAAAASAALTAATVAPSGELTNGPVAPTTNTETPTSQAQGTWEQSQPVDMQETSEKIIKKAKTEHESQVSGQSQHFTNMNAAPPPPAHSPASQPSPRHLQSPMPGPSGMNPPSAIRSPSHHQGLRERDGQASLVVSVPLPSTSYGINLSMHTQAPTPTDMAMSPHIFHQQKQATVESSMAGHPPHPHAHRAWSGLNLGYEQQHQIQQDPNKPGMSGMVGPNKENNVGPMPPMPPGPIRNKKRAAMTAAAAMANPPLPPPSAIQMASTSTQSLASVRRPPQPTPPPMYQEVKESPPSSPGPGGDRLMKKSEPKRWKRPEYRECCLSPRELRMSHTAPHMLGNELNPESGAAARLQEQLTAELAAHAAGTAGPDPLVPPPLINKAGGQGVVRGSSSAQSLDQLLERQWEQGSQFLMEQAQHFDIASLLSCLHQLRTENVRLEEHVANLLQRRDHLLAVNARLAIPLNTASTSTDAGRCSRDGSQIRPPPPRPDNMTDNRQHQPMPDQRAHQSYMHRQLMMRDVQQKPS